MDGRSHLTVTEAVRETFPHSSSIQNSLISSMFTTRSAWIRFVVVVVVWGGEGRGGGGQGVSFRSPSSNTCHQMQCTFSVPTRKTPPVSLPPQRSAYADDPGRIVDAIVYDVHSCLCRGRGWGGGGGGVCMCM